MKKESITIVDIARKCGVSVSTVSRAINDHPDIRRHTKELVLKTIKESNYIPNNSARNLKRSSSNNIAVLIKGITNPFFNSMLKIFEDKIQKRKYSFVLHRVDEKENEIDIAIELEKEKRLKGIIFLGGHLSHPEVKLKQLTSPFVFSTAGASEYADNQLYSYVAIDDVRESFRMVDYLCRLGHRRIAMITAAPTDESIGALRVKGSMQALEYHSIPFDPCLVRYTTGNMETYSMNYGYTVTKELLASGIAFSAIFAISDSMAVGAVKAISESGKRVPEDYSVAGYDGLDISFYYNPSITTIKQPVEAMAEETIRILFDKIDKKTGHEHRIFSAELIEGGSTRSIFARQYTDIKDALPAK